MTPALECQKDLAKVDDCTAHKWLRTQILATDDLD